MAFEENPAQRREVSVRRAPRYVPFMILGGVLGFVAAGIIAFALPGDPANDVNAVFGFFLIACVMAGVLLGAVAALILDRLSVRRARTVMVEAVPETNPGPAADPDSRDNGSGHTGS